MKLIMMCMRLNDLEENTFIVKMNIDLPESQGTNDLHQESINQVSAMIHGQVSTS